MKKTTDILKILLVIPVVLLVGLSIWVIWDEVNGKSERMMREIPVPTESPSMTMEEVVTEPVTEPVTKSAEELAETTMAQPEESNSATLLFAGDVLLSDHVLNAYDKAGGISGVLGESIREEISQADIFMVNQEFPFSERGLAVADKQFTFRLPPSRVHILQEMGVDLVTLANNHILDFGTEALVDSCTTLDNAGILYVGAGENLERAKKLEILEAGGKKIGFLGLSRVYMDGNWAASSNRPGVFSTYDFKMPVEEIKKARTLCDYLVVYVHWGVERETTPKDYQRVLGQQYVDAGADLIVGSHPHVLQGIEYYKGKPIVYSLGNFVFGSSIPRTALLKVELSEDEPVLSLIPCTSSGGYTKKQTDEAKVAAFYQEISGLSFEVQVGENGIVNQF